jgi:hypothetical protein
VGSDAVAGVTAALNTRLAEVPAPEALPVSIDGSF